MLLLRTLYGNSDMKRVRVRARRCDRASVRVQVVVIGRCPRRGGCHETTHRADRIAVRTAANQMAAQTSCARRLVIRLITWHPRSC